MKSKKQDNKTVELLINVYNAEQNVDAFFQSLQKQTYKNFSILIIDDGSTDNTVEKIQKYKSEFDIKLYKRPHQGLRKARHYGIQQTTADIIIIIDIDLILDPNAISELIKPLHNKQKVAGVGGILKGQAKTKTAKSYAALRQFFFKLREKNNQAEWLSGGFSAFKITAVDKTSGFSKKTTSADLDISWKLKKQGYKLKINKNAIAHHDDPNTMSEVWNREKTIGQREYYLTKKHPKKALTPKRLFRFYPLGLPLLIIVLILFWPLIPLILLISLILTMLIIKEKIQIRLLSWITFNIMNFAYCAGFLHSLLSKKVAL